MSDKRTQVNISIDRETFELIREAARQEHQSVSGFVAKLALYGSLESLVRHYPNLSDRLREQIRKQVSPEEMQQIARTVEDKIATDQAALQAFKSRNE